MDRRAVPDHQEPLARHPEEVQEELDTVQPVERFLPDQGVDAALGRHPPHDREVIARLLLAEDRGEPLRSVGLDHPREQVEPRFVLENQGPALAAGTATQFRPDLGVPAADRPLVPLDGPLDRLLGRPVQALEQPTDVVLVVADAELLLEDAGDAAQVQTRPRKPYASGPCQRSSGIDRR